MKKTIIVLSFLLAAIIACTVWSSCKKEEIKGKIYGTVTDFATGDPVGNVNVKLKPSGETTLTGSDGTYEFSELDAGKYSLSLSKAEYADVDDDYVIELEAGKEVKRDLQIRRRIASLHLLDMNGNALDTLDFGEDESVVIKTFNLFNDGTETLTCTANHECDWIDNVAGLENPIQPGQTTPVTVRIDRVALADGVNTTFLYITSGNGSNEIVVKATFRGTAVITTTEPIDVTANSVTVGGRISDDGGRPVLSRGICYGTSQTPDIDGTHTQDGADTGSFSHNITGLASSTTYYARAYATNRNGTYYASNIVSFTTENGLPTVTTTNVSNITATTAKSGGNVTNNGGYAVTARGVCWNTLGSPEVDNDPHTTNGNGNGSFSSNLTELAAGTTYHVRAYATNQQGTAYGPEVEFSTMSGVATITLAEATNVTASTVTCSANITNDGGASITERGFCWATSQYPTTTNSHSAAGSGTGEFSSSLINLAPGETYYLRAYAISSVGTSYSNQVSFTTGNGKPVVTTTGVSNITATTAKTGGNVTDNGGYDVTARGVCWNTLGNPDINDQHTTNGSGNGSFTSNLSGLTAGTTYHVRAYATNQQGTSYGPEEQFSTLNGNATITLNEATNITATTATCSANITDDGGANISERGFCWATSQYPTTTSNHSAVGTGTGSYSVSLINLTPGATYYVRAYAVNTTGTSYSNQISFSTTNGMPVVITGEMGTITATTAVCSGNVTTDGGVTVTARGFCWGTAQYPTVSNSYNTIGSGTGTFNGSINGLTRNTTYYIRAYATNGTGTAYGEQRTFTTNSGLPVVTTGSVGSITATSAVCSGTVSSDGGFGVVEKGLCWSTSQYPTVSDEHSSNGSGTGTFNISISGLALSTTYYVRAYATNEVGTEYGEQQSFTTKNGKPTVTTSNVTMNNGNVVAGGNVTSDGGYTVTARGICYGTLPNPNLTSNYTHTSDGTGTGYFSSSISQFNSGTIYVRAYATNANGTSYGAVIVVNRDYLALPTFTYNGHTYKVAPSPGSLMYFSDAYNYCTNLTLYDHTGWKLPTKAELLQMCAEKESIGGFETSGTSTNQAYWSQTYDGSSGGCSNYYYVRFNNCSSNSCCGSSTYLNCRPIRMDE